MYEIVLSNKAEKQLKKLDKPIRGRIISALKRIRIRPEVHVNKLVDDSGYKFRVGGYRIIMDIDHGKLIILVIKIGHRRNVYKNS